MSHFDFFTVVSVGNGANNLEDIFSGLLDRGIRLNNTVPLSLGGKKWFYYIRVIAPSDDQAEECLRGLGCEIIGRSWSDVYHTFEGRDRVFMVNVKRSLDGMTSVHRVPISEMRDGELPVDGVTRAPGIFSGDGVPEYPFSPEQHSDAIHKSVSMVRKNILEDNALSPGQKNQINRYLEAIEAILQQTDVDKGALALLAENLKKYAIDIGAQVGKRWAVEQLSDWLDILLSLLKDFN